MDGAPGHVGPLVVAAAPCAEVLLTITSFCGLHTYTAAGMGARGRHSLKRIPFVTFILIIISFPSPLTPSFHAENLTFLQILLTVAFLSSSGLATRIPQTVYCYF